MARDIYTNIVAKADSTNGNALVPLENVQVTVKVAGTSTLATIYQSKTGASQGPTPNAGAVGNNPFTTGSTGTLEFWGETGEYNIEIHDLQVPARASDYTVAWSSISAAAGGIPSSLLAVLGLDKIPALTADKLPTITKSKLEALVQEALIPSGVVVATVATVPDPGFLFCDGAAVSRTTYASLYAKIGVTHGSGNGTSTFNLPNYKGDVLVMRDTSQPEFDTMGESGGAKTHTLTAGQMPAHNHGVNDPGHVHPLRLNSAPSPSRGVLWGDGIGQFFAEPPAPNDLVGYRTTGISIQATGGNQSHNNIQPYSVVNYQIKT